MWPTLCCVLVASVAWSHAAVFDEELYEAVVQPELCASHLSEMSSFECTYYYGEVVAKGTTLIPTALLLATLVKEFWKTIELFVDAVSELQLLTPHPTCAAI